jgi:hypothetical protein
MAGKLGLALGAMVVLLVFVSAIGVIASGTARSRAARSGPDMYGQRQRMQLEVDAGLLALGENSVAGDYLAHVPANGDLASFHSAEQAFSAGYATVSKHSLSAAEARLLSKAKSAFGTYVSLSDEANQYFSNGQSNKAEALMGRLSVSSMLTPPT